MCSPVAALYQFPVSPAKQLAESSYSLNTILPSHAIASIPVGDNGFVTVTTTSAGVDVTQPLRFAVT